MDYWGSVLLERKDTHDIFFLVGIDKINFSGHKAIFEIASPIFHTMFNGPWVENKKKKVIIPEIDSEVFGELLNFIYKSEAAFTEENVIPLMYAAEKYEIRSGLLQEKCEDFIMEDIAMFEYKALKWYTEVCIYNCTRAKNYSLKIISYNIDTVSKTSEFLELPISILCAILKSDFLPIPEIQLFDILLRWGRADCLRKDVKPTAKNVRQSLKSALRLIRFPIMKVTDVANVVEKEKILNDKEIAIIYKSIALKDYPEQDGWFDKPPYFSSSPRAGMLFKITMYTQRGFSYGQTYCYRKRHDYKFRNSFIVNKQIILNSLGFYGSPEESAMYTIDVEILTTNGESLHKNQKKIFAFKNLIFYYRLEEPLKIENDREYIIEFSMDGPNTTYGIPFPPTKVHQTNCGPFGEVDFLYNVGGHNIPEILFNMDSAS